MKLRTFIWLACALNLVLILSIVRQGQPNTLDGPPTTGIEPASASAGEQITNEVRPTTTTTNNPSGTATNTGPPFHWEQVESDDYLQLVENLRGIGCPDDTIRDIVTARVLDDYANAAWEAQKPMQPAFWETMGKFEEIRDIAIPPLIEERLEAIQAEKRTTLAAVEKELAERRQPYRLNTDRWSFLSDELREQVRDIHEQIEATRKELRQELNATEDSETEEALRKSLRGLNDKRAEAIKSVIGEENWARYDATGNRSANWIRSVSGLSATTEELQEIARERDALERLRKPYPRDGTPEELDEFELAKDEIDQKQKELLVNLLGEERARHVERAADGDYLTMRNVARRHGLPMDVANRAYDVKQSAQTQLQELLAREQDAERRLKATAALLLTVKAELADVYGDQAWPAYEKYGMDWFEKLTASAEMVEDAPVQEQPQP